MNKMKRSLVLFAMALSMVFLAGTQDVKAAALKITNFKQTQASTSAVAFQAEAGTNASYYGAVLYKDAQCTQKVKTAYAAGSPEFTVTGLDLGTSYWVKIGYGSSSTNCYATGNLSTDAFEVITAPDAVTTIQFVDASEKTVTLTWNAAKGADLYLIETKDGEFLSKTNRFELTLKTGSQAIVAPVKCLSDGTPKALGKYTSISGLSTLSSSIANDSFGLTKMTSSGVTIAVGGSAAPVYGQYWEVEGKPIKGKGKKISAKDKALYASVSAKVTSNTMYQFRVRSYVVLSNGQKKYSKWSGYKYFLHSKGGKTISGEYGKITVKWKKFKGCDRVVIKMATSKNGKYKKVATVKPGAKKAVITKFGKKALQSYKTYYVRIEYQKKVKGKYKISEIVGNGKAWCR
ncbi:MAG: hypothetical protein K6E84_04055 [Lachnospiraceae bacterium]|nr:hypothetical protein [Lachnospiraceae bacterium]